jgi:serine-type D-Ala-D-Ala carboxypeptidase
VLKFETYIQSLIRRRMIPGMSLLVGKGNTLFFQNHYGNQALLPQKIALQENTLYDLVSLTKFLITGLLTLYLVEHKALTLETEVKAVFPELEKFGNMNVLHLLTHTSGLPGWYPLYLFGQDYLKRFPYLPLQSRPGQRLVYSCPGYILLYYLLQQVSGTTFQTLAQQVIFDPLGLKNTFLTVPTAFRHRAAPTEYGNKQERKKTEAWVHSAEGKFYYPLYLHFPWRESIIQGETHDLYSHHIGGTAGNAGLFSTTSDLFQLGRQFFPSSATILSPETLQWCWKNLTPFKRSHRTIGFKRNSSFFSAGGRAFSRHAIGHNGFTGPSIWLDTKNNPLQDITIILLTNLIHPEVKEINFNRIRKKLHHMLLSEC